MVDGCSCTAAVATTDKFKLPLLCCSTQPPGNGRAHHHTALVPTQMTRLGAVILFLPGVPKEASPLHCPAG